MYYLTWLRRAVPTDRNADYVDSGEGMGRVVVGCRPPWGTHVEEHVVDLVNEQATPALARVGRQGAGARLAAGLVAEQHRPAGFPAQGVRAKEPSTAVVADVDCPA